MISRVLWFIPAVVVAVASSITNEADPAPTDPADFPALINDMRLLVTATRETIVRVHPAIVEANISSLAFTLSALILVTEDTADRMEKMEPFAEVGWHPVGLAKLSLQLLRWAGAMRDAVVAFAQGVPQNLGFGDLLTVKRNAWGRMVVRASVLHNLISLEIQAMKSEDPALIAVQRLYLFNDVRQLLDRALDLGLKLEAHGHHTSNQKDRDTMKAEIKRIVDGQGGMEPLLKIVRRNVESIARLVDQLPRNLQKEAKSLVDDWHVCLAKCEALTVTRTAPSVPSPAEAELPKKPSKKQLRAQHRREQKTSHPITEDEEYESPNPELSAPIVPVVEERVLKSMLITEDEITVDEEEFEIVGARRKPKSVTPNVKYLITIPMKKKVGADAIAEEASAASQSLVTGPKPSEEIGCETSIDETVSIDLVESHEIHPVIIEETSSGSCLMTGNVDQTQDLTSVPDSQRMASEIVNAEIRVPSPDEDEKAVSLDFQDSAIIETGSKISTIVDEIVEKRASDCANDVPRVFPKLEGGRNQKNPSSQIRAQARRHHHASQQTAFPLPESHIPPPWMQAGDHNPAIPQSANPSFWTYQIQAANSMASSVLADISFMCDQVATSAVNPALSTEARAQRMRAECVAQLLADMRLASDALVGLSLPLFPGNGH